jgi:acid phosphatase type 7
MKSMKLGLVWILVGMGLAMLLSVGFLGSEGSVSAQDSIDPVFLGAGDIASCSRSGDEATAKLLEDIVAAAPSTTTVYTTGDNAYESGTASEFANCYDPSWGRPPRSRRERIRP